MIDAEHIELIPREDGGFTLSIRNQRFDLSPSGFAKFCRVGNAFKHRVERGVDSGPPYVVHVKIPYLDFGRDQDTRAYNYPVYLKRRKDAELIIPALRAELEAMGFTPDRGYCVQYETSVDLLSVPEDRFYTHNTKGSKNITDALVGFRYDIAVKSDLRPSADWWESFGLEEDDMTADRDRFRHNH